MEFYVHTIFSLLNHYRVYVPSIRYKKLSQIGDFPRNVKLNTGITALSCILIKNSVS